MSLRSGAEIFKALIEGEPVTWRFNPKEKRVILTLPKHLGGQTYELCIAGSYTFVARPMMDGFLGPVSTGAALGSSGPSSYQDAQPPEAVTGMPSAAAPVSKSERN
ncbi:MAG TPA: hypothetical protein VGQ12_04230 [Candidatus Angelobacter sp.]|jgi:hypothetical protein|nr:hypothetical protein [Candidatus Angelobacter sp.]